MVKWLKKYQDRVALVAGMILIAITAFAGGILWNESAHSTKKPLVLSQTAPAQALFFTLEKIEDNQISAKTDPASTVKLGETEILPVDSEGNFQFDPKQGSTLTILKENDLIKIDLSAVSALLGSAMEQNPQPESAQTSEVKNSQSQNSAPQTKLQIQGNTNTSQVTPQTGQFVGSKNSTKYHLPSCRFAKNIKPANQVWFTSAEEAKSRGYQPCGTCIK